MAIPQKIRSLHVPVKSLNEERNTSKKLQDWSLSLFSGKQQRQKNITLKNTQSCWLKSGFDSQNINFKSKTSYFWCKVTQYSVLIHTNAECGGLIFVSFNYYKTSLSFLQLFKEKRNNNLTSMTSIQSHYNYNISWFFSFSCLLH